MAVAIRLKFAGVTAEQFDQVHAAVDPHNNRPDRMIFHSCGPTDGGWGVWESRMQFDRFAAERVGPAAAASGFTGQPAIREFPVHEYFI